MDRTDYKDYIRQMAEPLEVKYKGILKPCPFCGGTARLIRYLADDVLRFRDKYAVQCEYTGSGQGCGAEGQLNTVKDRAISAWNKIVAKD